MTATVKVGPTSYTVIAAPTQDSRGNWTCPTYTVNGQAYDFPQNTKAAVHTYDSCGKAEAAAIREAQRMISQQN